jgi:hypothetical protein
LLPSEYGTLHSSFDVDQYPESSARGKGHLGIILKIENFTHSITSRAS